MGATTQLTASDGHTLGAYRAGPEFGACGLVVVQEIFGVNSHMRHVSDVFAAAGYAVIAPALFDRAERGVELGYQQTDVAAGLALRGKIPMEDTMADILAAATALGSRPIGIVGYCWGGTIAWLGATRTHAFKAAVGWYGGGIAATRTETPNCPVELHFGGADTGIPSSDVDAIKAAQPGIGVFVYPDAGHGFGCEQRGSYSEKDAQLAQQRTLAFFAKHLV